MGRAFALVAYVLFGAIMIWAIFIIIIIIIIVIIIIVIIIIIMIYNKCKYNVSIHAVDREFLRVNMFQSLYRFKVAVKVRNMVFDKLTIYYSLIIGFWNMVYMTKVVGFYEFFNMIKENFIVYKLYC